MFSGRKRDFSAHAEGMIKAQLISNHLVLFFIGISWVDAEGPVVIFPVEGGIDTCPSLSCGESPTVLREPGRRGIHIDAGVVRVGAGYE